MSDYTQAPATKLLASHCCICGRPLLDARSVELGIGPECGELLHFASDIGEGQREVGNQLVHAASVFATQGRIGKVRECARALAAVGLIGLADALDKRFADAERKARVEVQELDGMIRVRAPFKRSCKAEYLAALRAVPGRRWVMEHEVNEFPVSSKPQVLALLSRFYAGEYGLGPKGVFRVPEEVK